MSASKTSNVISIATAASYADHMLRADGRWCEFAITCWNAEKAEELADALAVKGLETTTRGRVVTARYDADDAEGHDVPVNMAVVATAGSFADADQVFQTLTNHDETPAYADVISL